LLVAIIWAAALGLIFSSVNVYLRDTQHFLELLLLAWFWLTPIVYQFDFVAQKLQNRFGEGWERLAILNPMVPVVTTLQRVVYNPAPGTPADPGPFDMMLSFSTAWYATNLLIVGSVGILVLFLGFRVFGRLEANFGEEI